MPKIKRVGSLDGGSSCKDCYYLKGGCTKPSKLESCCISSRVGRVRFCIFVEDKETDGK
jgi:hypothetical protein